MRRKTPEERIAVCSWSLCPRDGRQLRDLVGQAGLAAVQIALSPLAAGVPGEGPAAVNGLRAAGLRVVSGMMAFAGEDYSTLDSIARTGGVRPDDTWLTNLAHAQAVAELAADARIDLVTFHAGFIPEGPEDPERATLLERLRAVAAAFDRRGVDVGFETGQETAETLVRALDELGCENVGVNFDPGNMILYGKGDPVTALARLAPRVLQVHVKDALPAERPGSWGTEVAAGRGAVDWPAFFDIALAITPPVNFVIEREAGGDRLDDVRAARDLIAAHLLLERFQ